MKKTILILALFSTQILSAQDWHVIQFADKGDIMQPDKSPEHYLSDRAISRREAQGISWDFKDYPVDRGYLDSLRSEGITIRYTSKWLNAALIKATSAQLNQSLSKGFVKGVMPRLTGVSIEEAALSDRAEVRSLRTEQTIDYGAALDQVSLLGIPRMHQQGYLGSGIHIAVLDAGFPGVQSLDFFDSLRLAGHLLGAYDLFGDDDDPYHGSDHGTKVLSIMAANTPEALVGGSPHASYWLFKTENVSIESPVEEFFWLIAAEKADSVGADIIHTSLGYTEFTEDGMSYTQDDLDGHTALITRAADWASRTGILVITSAGNLGTDTWSHVTMPADADSILSVGATNYLGIRNPASSYGLTTDGRQKPEVMAMGTSAAMVDGSGRVIKTGGTSYAAPMVTSLAAGLWQAYPDLSNMELRQAIIQSGTRSSSPTPTDGYGIPQFTRATHLLSPTGLEDQQTGRQPSAYYRSSQLHISMPDLPTTQPLELTVLDLTGRTLYQQIITPSHPDFSLHITLPKGISLLIIQSPEHRYLVRIKH